MIRWALAAVFVLALPASAQGWATATPRPTPRPTYPPAPTRTATPRPTSTPSSQATSTPSPQRTPTPSLPPCACERVPLIRLQPSPFLVGQPVVGGRLNWPDGVPVEILLYHSDDPAATPAAYWLTRIR